DDHRQPQCPQSRQRRTGARRELHAARIHVVGHIRQHGAVLVEENRRSHGQDVSFMGRTMTSGITVSGGCVSTNFTALATFNGSCSSDASMSGKRSNRKGVRMPPAITADTLTPTDRSSACRAWVKPIRPHLLA